MDVSTESSVAEGNVGVRTNWSTRDEKLARATLLALRMTLSDPDEGGDVGYCLLPHQAPMELHHITAALVEMEKPVTCIGIGVGGLLGVGCWPLPPEDVRMRQEATHLTLRRNAAIRGQLAGETGTANILLLGYGENLLLSWDEYVEWQGQYFLYMLQSTLRTADAQQRELGAQRALEICGIRKDGSSGGGLTR
jgi:hypothetical protein